MTKFICIPAIFFLSISAAYANDIPACAKTGATTVIFNGKPALKLSDVTSCPTGTYEIIPNVMIEGQPMVHFDSGASKCKAVGSPNVIVDGKSANTVGDVACSQ